MKKRNAICLIVAIITLLSVTTTFAAENKNIEVIKFSRDNYSNNLDHFVDVDITTLNDSGVC